MRLCRSRPLKPGSVTSTARRLDAERRGRARKSRADAKVSDCQPARRISASSDSHTETSSSTTNATGVACNMGDDLDAWTRALAKLMYIPRAHARAFEQGQSGARGGKCMSLLASKVVSEEFNRAGICFRCSFRVEMQTLMTCKGVRASRIRMYFHASRR